MVEILSKCHDKEPEKIPYLYKIGSEVTLIH